MKVSIRSFAICVLSIFLLSGFSPLPSVSVTELEHGEFAHHILEYIDENWPKRIAFSERELQNALWIRDVLIEIGFDSEYIYIQQFPKPEFMGASMEWILTSWGMNPDESHPDTLPTRDYSQNVILTIPGRSEKTIIVGAHYDSVYNHGISDNASGMVVLFESAARMLHTDNYYTIQYVFWGAEEVGLLGASYFVENMTEEESDNLILYINIDVIFDGSELNYGVGFLNLDIEDWGLHHNDITLRIKEIAETLNYEQGLGLVRQEYGVFVSSDNLIFVHRGFNVLALHAVANFEPGMPFAPGAWLSSLEHAKLAYAYLNDIADEEQLELIEEHRLDFEWTLRRIITNEFDLDLERIEMFIEEFEGEEFEWIEDELKTIEILMGLTDHPALEYIELQPFGGDWLTVEELAYLAVAMLEGTDDYDILNQIELYLIEIEFFLHAINMATLEIIQEEIAILQEMYEIATREREPEEETQETQNGIIVINWHDNSDWIQHSITRLELMIPLLDHPGLEGLELSIAPNLLPLEIAIEVAIAILNDEVDDDILELLEKYEEGIVMHLGSFISQPIEWLEEHLDWLEQNKAELEAELANATEGIRLIERNLASAKEQIESLNAILEIVEHPNVEYLVEKLEIELNEFEWSGVGMGYVLHTPNDNLTFLDETWPGLVENALRAYNIFLEKVLMWLSDSEIVSDSETALEYSIRLGVKY